MRPFLKRCTHPIFISNVISIEEETKLLSHLNKLLSRRKYEGDHWDSVIQSYKEIEVGTLPTELNSITDRIRTTITEHINKHITVEGGNISKQQVKYLPTHVIDLSATGHIGPHVDSIKFSGGIVASLSLLSARILRLRLHDEESAQQEYDQRKSTDDNNEYTRSSASTGIKGAEALANLKTKVQPGLFYEYEYYCPPRSLYILTDQFRYNYTHEILGQDSMEPSAVLKGRDVKYDRRVSLLFRDEL